MSHSLLDDVIALSTPAHVGSTDRDLSSAVWRQELHSMLPLEEASKPAVRRVVRHALMLELSGMGYPRLSLEPLRWRDDKGRPRLVLFRVRGNPTITFSPWQRPEYPRPIADCYADVSKRPVDSGFRRLGHGLVQILGLWAVGTALSLWTQNPWYLVLAPVGFVTAILTHYVSPPKRALSCTFTGLIPVEVREKIRLAESRGLDVCVLAEVDEWTEEVARLPLDPLVVGWKHGALYLIDRFDTTTVEELVAREFTTDETLESPRDQPAT
mgnify:CR=1 FL=1